MASSPSKRRKLSPTTSVPIAAPTTPSRIPVPRQDTRSANRPSFASPTKASLSRHHPQLLARPSSSGAGAQRHGGRGNALSSFDGNVPVRGVDAVEHHNPALRTSIEDSDGTPSTIRMRATSQPLETGGVRSLGRGMSAKPRRMSRSPMKETRETNAEDGNFHDNENIDPFRKTGLRRSPQGPSEQDAQSEGMGRFDQELFDISDPFRKTGLRRSPMVSKHAEPEPVPGEPDTVTDSGRQEPPDNTMVARIQETENENVVEALSQTQIRSASRRLSQKAYPPVEAIGVVVETQSTSAKVPEEITSDVSKERQPTRSEDPVEKALPSAKAMPEVSKEAQHTRATGRAEITTDFRKETQSSKTAEPATSDQRDANEATITERASQDKTPVPELRRPVLPAQQNDIEEPELPLTPTQRGLVDPIVTTAPSGIHNTPSRRSRRDKALAPKVTSSSLKPHAERLNRGAEAVKDETKPGKAFKKRISARFLVPEDSNASKKRERDELQKELQKLQSDVDIAKQECERARLQLESGQHVSSTPPNSKELLDLLLRSTVSDAVPPLKISRPSLLADLGSFLPFSSCHKSETVTSAAPEGPPPSHLPVSVDDPLPYLRLFTPLEYESRITMLPTPPPLSDGNNSSLLMRGEALEKHYITARSPTGFFSAQLTMTVDTDAFQITSIDIGNMDQNAEAELGTFMRKRVSSEDDEAVYSIGKDISVLGWAMGRWVEVSILRARFWCNIDLDFGTAKARAKSLEKTAVKRRRKRAVVIDEEVAGDLAGEEARHKWTRRQLLPYMGRTALGIIDESNGVELRFEWRLDFDWTGEVDSNISATAKVQTSWRQPDAEDRKDLIKVPETFDRMLRERGPLGAVKAIVGLLMPGV